MNKREWLCAEAAKCAEMAAKLDIRVIEGTAAPWQARAMRDLGEKLRLEAFARSDHDQAR